MSARALFSSFLLVMIFFTAVSAAPAAVTKPKAKIALGAKKKPKKAKKAKKTKKVKKVAKKRTTAKTATAPQQQSPAPVAPAAPATCENTSLVPDAGNLELIRAAIACLHNQIRAQNGLVTLAENGALAAAAAGHTNDMIARGYFDHSTPEGGTFDTRIIAAGYARAGDGWTLGENLAWGTGQLATPAALMQSWMNSSRHRDNILMAAYREIGLGVALGTPTGAAGGVTISAEFGTRN